MKNNKPKPSPHWQTLPNVDSDCFACGLDNPSGLRMTFETNGEKVRSRLIVPDHMRGWNNIVHGGILSTICDEIMSWSAIVLTQRFILTKTMTVRFLRPVKIGTKLTAQGFVKKRISERNALVKAEIFNPEGEVAADSRGEFVLFTEDQFRPLNIVPETYIRTMTDMLFRLTPPAAP